MKKFILTSILLVFLTGCASNELYYDSVNRANETNAKVELAKAQAEVERMRMLTNISQSGNESAQVAAVMALAFGGQQSGGNSNSSGAVAPQKPESAGDTAFRWATLLVPSLTTLYAVDQAASTQQQQIQANRDVSINSNRTMLGFGQLAAGDEATIVGGEGDRVLTPQPPIVGGEGDSLLFPQNPADQTVIGTEDDVLLFPTN